MVKNQTGDSTKIVIIETKKNVIVKEKEGRAKNGDPKVTRVSNFKGPGAIENAVNYLKDKIGT